MVAAVVAALAVVWYAPRRNSDPRLASIMAAGAMLLAARWWMSTTDGTPNTTADAHAAANAHTTADAHTTANARTAAASDARAASKRPSLHSRAQLAKCVLALEHRIPRLRTTCPRKLGEAIDALEDFFSAADALVVARPSKRRHMATCMQSLRDKRANALNALHSLHFNIPKHSHRSVLYKCVHMARLESLRSISVVAVRHGGAGHIGGITPMSLYVGGPAPTDPETTKGHNLDIF